MDATVSHLDNNPDEYDNIAIRGYSDDIDGDAEIIAVSTPQSHNFHSSSDVDWTIILPSSVTKNYTYSTQNVGLNSDTDISIYKVTSIVANPNYPNQNRYIINSKQLIVSDNIGETSIDFTAIAGFYYVVKSTSRNGTSGDETTYSAQLTSMTPDAYEDDDSLNLSKQIPINGVF